MNEVAGEVLRSVRGVEMLQPAGRPLLADVLALILLDSRAADLGQMRPTLLLSHGRQRDCKVS